METASQVPITPMPFLLSVPYDKKGLRHITLKQFVAKLRNGTFGRPIFKHCSLHFEVKMLKNPSDN